MQVGSISNFSVHTTWLSGTAMSRINEVKEETTKSSDSATQNALNEVNQEITAKQTQSAKENKKPASTKPWASLMYQLNLTPTGDFTKDYNLTITRLNELISYTRNPQKIQEYLTLADRVSIVFVNPQSSSKLAATSGSEQIAQINRVMMLNIKTSI